MIYDLQKASFWKRASAFLFDLVIMLVVVVGVAALMSTLMHYDTHIEGMAFLRDIEGDYYTYDEARFEVVGRATGRRIAFGDEVWIRVKGVDMRRRTIDFELIVGNK